MCFLCPYTFVYILRLMFFLFYRFCEFFALKITTTCMFTHIIMRNLCICTLKKLLCRYFVPICMCVSIMYELFSKFNLLTGSQFMAFSNKHIYCAVPCHKTYTRVDMLLWYLQVKYCLFDSFVVFTRKQTYKRY